MNFTNERKMEEISSQTQCPVFERLQRHIGERVDRLNFFNMTHTHFDFTFNGQPLYCAILLSMDSLCIVLFYFQWTAFVLCYFIFNGQPLYCAILLSMDSLCIMLLFPIKTFIFWHLSNDCQIACSALVSSPSNRKPYNKHL